MKKLDKRLREYKYLNSKIYCIELDIELYELYGKSIDELIRFRSMLIEESKAIERAIQTLNDNENFLLNRIYIDCMNMSEIARILKINRATCYKRKEKILNKIDLELKSINM